MIWIAWLAPLVVIMCVCIAIKHTRIRRYGKILPIDLVGIAESMRKMNGTERKWGLR